MSNDPLNPDVFHTADRIDFEVGGKKVAEAMYKNLKLKVVAKGISDLAKEYMRIFLEDYIPGQILRPKGFDAVVLGPKRAFTHSVVLHAFGNPDHGQYADLVPRRTVLTVGIGEATKVCVDFQADNNMGSGNCGKDHGRVSKLNAKGSKAIGRVSYNGSYKTNEEIAAQEAEWRLRYPKATA